MSGAPVQSQFLRQTAVELAKALGVHRNTLSAYRQRGAPPGPPYCELQWRVWMAGQGHADLAPATGLLAEQLARAGVAGYRAAAPAAAEASPVVDWREATERAKAQAAEIEARQKIDEYERQRRQLVHVDDARRILLAVAPAILAGFSDLPNVAGEIFPDDVAEQARARTLVARRVAALRERLAKTIAEELGKFLEGVT